MRRARAMVAAEYQPILRQIGLDADGVFSDPRIKPWRSLPERDNCTLDAVLADGRAIRLHLKRYQPSRATISPAEHEARGIQALIAHRIPTVPPVSWGTLADGRSYVITADLTGFTPADKLIESGTPFDALLLPTAELAANLHRAGLHHRDLYLCHFFARVQGSAVGLRLIDAARVQRLPRLLRRRWIVKDLAQFWYSTTKLPITDPQRIAWLDCYVRQSDGESADHLRSAIARKVAWIARHDATLNRKQPRRNISIPQP